MLLLVMRLVLRRVATNNWGHASSRLVLESRGRVEAIVWGLESSNAKIFG